MQGARSVNPRTLSAAEEVRGSPQSLFSAMEILPLGTSWRKAATAAACARSTLPTHSQTCPFSPLRSCTMDRS